MLCFLVSDTDQSPNLQLAVGPLGRNAEGMGSINTSGKAAAMYVFSSASSPYTSIHTDVVARNII
jgi:lipid-binding SYLF domain-containing protein